MKSTLTWCLLFSGSVCAAEFPQFRVRAINPESTYCAVAAIDVNTDGKLDIVCGGFWYAAPDWQRHFLRDVAMIRGRYDDYSHLPLDVDGDGRLDYVSANYRSSSLYWVRNPGGAAPWTKHLIDEPGPMETAILADVDGDGAPDVLPNGTKFAAWWSLTRPGAATSAGAPIWTRHDLPGEVAGHGVGFGDINGDGRGDIVGPHGWLEAPQDRRSGRWVMHHDFELDRDVSIPLLVVDVDGDGDNDLVWGRGHNFGAYWLEQDRAAPAEQRWTRHCIDANWSQAHAPAWVDLNNDGQAELVCGKRYLAHDGRDPGEYDPLVIAAYQFDPRLRSWQTHWLQVAGPAGLGLDPKFVDLDADGDVDILAPGRSGLYLLENQLLIPSAAVSAPIDSPTAHAPEYPDHARVMVYRDADGEHDVTTAFHLGLRRRHILAGMERAMGPLPGSSRRVPLQTEWLKAEETKHYTRHTIRFVPEPGDVVPAYLLVPLKLAAKNPAMLCLHQTTGIGKGEPAGLGGLANLHYAHELAERGFVCLVPDYPSFGDYRFDFAAYTDRYGSGSMKAIWNNLRGVDLLISLPYVDADHIGCIGHSLGGHNALFTAAFDQRIGAVVTSCGFTPFHDYYEGKIAGWTSDRYMPRLRDVYGNDPDRVPFDFYEVLAAIAPRGVYINAPLGDGNFAVAGVRKAVDEARRAYVLREAGDRLVVEYPDAGHDFPTDVRTRVYDWLATQLQ